MRAGAGRIRIASHNGHHAVLRHCHDGCERHFLMARLRHEARAQAVSTQIALEAGEPGALLHGLVQRRRRQGKAKALLP